MALLVHGRQITPDATKRGGSAIAAKRSGDLLLNFHHAKIPLREIVRKWQSQVVEKGQPLSAPCSRSSSKFLAALCFCRPRRLIASALTGGGTFLHFSCHFVYRLLTVLTDHGAMVHYLIGPLHCQERVAGMPRLSSGILLSSLASTYPLSKEPIIRWRFTAILAILLDIS